MTDVLVTSSAFERPLPPSPVSFEDFLAWAPESARVEWVDGEIVIMSPANIEHERLDGFLLTLLRLFVEAHGLGEVLGPLILMRLRTRPSGREPDVLFVAAAHADRLRDTYLDGPADLVVEIVSPDSVRRDRRDKLAEYEAAGIPEYWLIDPLRREAWFYELGADGRYRPAQLDEDGLYHSKVLEGFRLRVGWLWQRPLPTVREVLREAGVP